MIAGPADPSATVSDAIAAIWQRNKPTVERQLLAVEAAIAAMSAGRLDETGRAAAERDAHRLAGSAGTFGFPQASVFARELEEGLRREASGAAPARLADIVVALREELAKEPVVTAPPAAGRAALDAGPEEGRILIVDGDATLTDQLVVEAAARGLLADVATTIGEARKALTLQRPILALVGGVEDDDAMLFELVELLSAGDRNVPALIMARGEELHHRLAAVRVGARAFLQRSMPPSQMIEAVSRTLAAAAVGDQAKILVVDDDPSIIEAIAALLGHGGMRVTALDDPGRFWDVLEEVGPDLLVLDEDMPGVTGVELCKMVRADPRWAELPVLFLTAAGDDAIIQRVFQAGADDFVRKPIDGGELLLRITNRLERLRLYRRLADTDHLTGVGTRRKAVLGMAQLLRLAQRYEQTLSVALLDLDHFKQVNDAHGHAIGDRVLRLLGNLLSRTFRGEDVVARWGGEEFFVGLYGMSRADAVQRIAQLLEAFREESAGIAGDLRASFSAGVAQYPDDGRDLSELSRAADTALYEAKRAGRDRVVPAR